jgi:hypothetical protein
MSSMTNRQTTGTDVSRSHEGKCYDNVLAESFFATLKTECFADQLPAFLQRARIRIFDYVETVHKPERLQSALGYQSPWTLNINSIKTNSINLSRVLATFSKNDQ